MTLIRLRCGQVGAVLLFWATLVSVSAIFAGESALHVGQHVLARRSDVALYEGNRAVQRVPTGMMLDVLSIEGRWLWTGRGWVRNIDVVPLEEAISYFDDALRQRPSTFALVNRARAHLELREYDLAIADCSQAIELEAGFAPAYCVRGRAYVKRGNHDQALSDLSRALELDANHSLAYLGRIQVWLERRDWDKVIHDATEAVRVDPKLALALAARGRALLQKGEHERAIADFDSAIAINPHLCSAWNNRGNARFKKGEYERAIADYTAALEFAPNAQVHLNRAIAWQRLGVQDKAEQDFGQTIELDPKLVPSNLRSAQLEPGDQAM